MGAICHGAHNADVFSVSAIRQQELREAITDSPLWVLGNLFVQQLFGWPAYLFNNASGQLWYRPGTNRTSCFVAQRTLSALVQTLTPSRPSSVPTTLA